MAERAAKQLELNKSELPNSITEVIATLSRAGFEAYIVGGGVRDTLLGLKPKDFDAVTDAKPHEIKDVFGKRCRIIGRRFQLAHVYSGRELIEVATFRGPPNNTASTNQDGMILRDNVWGDIQQDFARRDFSINALYYQPLKGVVHDFCGALNDIDNKIIRLLGNAPVRIEEDPVRLLRALRFKAKLGFEFDDELAAQFNESNWALLEQISPHRLYDETQKMFTGGYLVPLLPLLFESGAIDSLIIYPPSEPNALVKQVAINTDKRINAGKSINPAFFYAALLWENYLHQLEKAKKRNMPFAEAQLQAAGKVIDRQRIKTAIPKFAEQFIRDIWLLQPKLSAPRSKQIEQLAEHPRFRAGFDFLLLREQCGDAEHPLSESTNGMGEWWQTYQTLTEREQQQAIDSFDETIRRGAHKRGRGRHRQSSATHTDSANSNSTNSNSSSTNPSRNNNDNPNQKSVNDPSTPDNHQKLVNDVSNIPSRRRRAPQHTRSESDSTLTSKAESHSSDFNASSNSSADTNVNDSQAKPSAQDNHELTQLQQLSLAHLENHHRPANASPAPLFVAPPKSMVPPLKKNIVESTSAKEVDTSESQNEKVTAQMNPQADIAKTKGNKGVSDKKSKSTEHSKVTDTKSTIESDKPKHDRKAEPVAKPKVTRTIAQAPQLITIDNEPIPYKRRRRQSSAQSSIAPKLTTRAVSDRVEPITAAKPAEKYQKKAPKPADTATPNPQVVKKADGKAASQTKVKADKKAATQKPTAKKPAVNADSKGNAKADHKQTAKTINQPETTNTTTNLGPIPAKRRRRQPSSDRRHD